MKLKSYVKNIEEENYTLRQRIEELDSKINELNETIDDFILQVNMTVTVSLTDGIDDFFSHILSPYTAENDAICDIGVNMCHTLSNHVSQPYGYVYRKERMEKFLDAQLQPKWTIEYWYLGLRFQKVSFTLCKKKKNYTKVIISNSDKIRNFSYVEEEDEKRMSAYTNRPPVYYKKKIYDYINASNYKPLFTPYK